MQGAELPDSNIVLILNRDELRLLNNSINEATNALDAEEFRIRTGSTVNEAETLLGEVHSLLENLSK